MSSYVRPISWLPLTIAPPPWLPGHTSSSDS